MLEDNRHDKLVKRNTPHAKLESSDFRLLYTTLYYKPSVTDHYMRLVGDESGHPTPLPPAVDSIKVVYAQCKSEGPLGGE